MNKIQIKMLGTDVRLEQARKGIGAVMCGKRKRLKGKEEEVGEKKTEKKRVKDNVDAAFMDNWARPKPADNGRQGTDWLAG